MVQRKEYIAHYSTQVSFKGHKVHVCVKILSNGNALYWYEHVKLLTVIGFGSKIRVMSFMAPSESHGGQLNSPDEICTKGKMSKGRYKNPETRIGGRFYLKERIFKKSCCSLFYKDSLD